MTEKRERRVPTQPTKNEGNGLASSGEGASGGSGEAKEASGGSGEGASGGSVEAKEASGGSGEGASGGSERNTRARGRRGRGARSDAQRDSETSAGERSEPSTPKKANRKKAPSTQPHVDAHGRDRPAFLLEFPQDPALDRLVAAFERGDYRLVRDEAARLEGETQDPAVRRGVRELRRRIDPDPLAKYLLFLAIGLLVFIVCWTYATLAGKYEHRAPRAPDTHEHG